jgi:hypothetical protein
MTHTIHRDTDQYEAWLRKHCRVVENDLKEKHRRMRGNVLAFLRASYFRWARTIESVCPELASAPRVACIGDIHVENFGTWRDADSRLVWGVNDYDEVAFMPYAYDLVRLATSAILTPPLRAGISTVVAAILDGYRRGLADPRAALLDQRADWLRSFANPTARSNRSFWRTIDACPDARPPSAVRRALMRRLPDDCRFVRFASLTRGVGSLGKPRFIAIADWNGGIVVREAKAVVPSAWIWAHDKKESRDPWFVDLARGSFRSPDPLLGTEAGFVIRRLAPDARKIELTDVPGPQLSARLLAAMGADLAAVHAADPRSPKIAQDLEARAGGWLLRAARAASEHTERDFAAYVAQGSS